MKFLAVITAALACAFCASASVLEVGPIGLTGSGTFFNPDGASYGGDGHIDTLGIVFSGSGSNGVDTVTINTNDIEVMFTPLSDPVFRPFLCQQGLTVYTDICNVSIDGITGFSSLSNIGGGNGKVQVFASVLFSGGLCCAPGPLLAEAQVFSQVQITSVTYQGTVGEFQSTFAVTPTPEPSTLALGLIGLAALGWLRRRTMPQKNLATHL